MSTMIVEGGSRLSGTISAAGNKNEALPVISAALLCSEPVKLLNVPAIGDVRTMLRIAEALGAEVSSLKKGSVSIQAGRIEQSMLPLNLAQEVRASILFASSLLVRTGKAVIPQPGGDHIGRRRLDTHFHVFQALGAKLEISRKPADDGAPQTLYTLRAPDGLKGAEIYLDEASVTGTENALIAAAGARGRTIIANAASEPHVQGLCWFLQKIGVKIKGIGSNLLTVYGTDSFGSGDHIIGSDYVEAASFIGLAAATKSEITITNVNPHIMRMIFFQFRRIGVEVETEDHSRTVHVPSKQPLKIQTDLGGAIPKIEDAPWPGFPADLVSIILVAATQCKGICLFHEKLFEARLFFTDRLQGMGAQIVLCDPHRAVVSGPSPLFGSTIVSPDIRAGMALLIAALAAEGTSVIHNIEQVDRGYQDIDARLRGLGAKVERKMDRRKKGG